MKKAVLKQILLITDGCSNQGEDPIAVAALAHEQGITVNVIGVVTDDVIGEQGIKEIEEIALSGGGVSQIVYAKQLAQTVQMVTRKAMTQTICGVVNKELSAILGKKQEMEDLPPEKRGEVMEVVDELGETLPLEVCLVVDISASMKDKLPTVQEALIDLSVSLQSRVGGNRFALCVFPGKRSEVDKLLNWTPRFQQLTNTFEKLSSGGITPTGPALKEAVQLFSTRRSLKGMMEDETFIEESGM
jgi:Ca-activated chloride channel homolog